MKLYKKLVAFLIAVMISASFVSFRAEVFADDTDEALGDASSMSGYFLPDKESEDSRALGDFYQDRFDDGGYTYYLIFSINATGVKNLLTSDMNKEVDKSFFLSSLPSSAKYITCIGTLTHSGYYDSDTADGKAGVCYLDEELAKYFPAKNADESKELAIYGGIGLEYQEKFLISDYLHSGVQYFAFIKNENGNAGWVTGSLALYHSIA